MPTIMRTIRFVAWIDASAKKPFDRVAAAKSIGDVAEDEIVMEENDALTAVEVVQAGTDTTATAFAILALRDFDNRPLGWGPGTLPEPIEIADDTYTADLAHAVIWEDHVAAVEVHRNAPGLGRLQRYMSAKADQRVVFRSLYQPDLTERLKDLDGIRGLEFGVHEPQKAVALKQTGLASLVPEALGPRVPSAPLPGPALTGS